MDGPWNASQYRYPGPAPFGDSAPDILAFRGRDVETETVVHSILSSDLFVLYSMSSLGKTSLIRAGVVPQLRRRGLWPVSVRLNDPTARPAELIEAQIRTMANADPAVELVRDAAAAAAVSGDDGLWQLLSSVEVWRADELQRLVLIFDQFEEFFVLDWTDEVRSQFIAEFGEVIRGRRMSSPDGELAPRVKVVLVIREDFLGELEVLADDVPQIMRNRLRLRGLRPDEAEMAITEPAALEDPRFCTRTFSYSDGAIQAVIEFLRPPSRRPGSMPSVDPSQLQLVCQYVERSILPAKALADPGVVPEITHADLGGFAGLQQIIGDFYARTLATLAAKQRRAAQMMCETMLVSAEGRRLSREEGEITQIAGVHPTVLRQLVDARLLRAEARVGSTYYELAHDALVPGIVAERLARRELRGRRNVTVAGAVVALVAIALVLLWMVAAR